MLNLINDEIVEYITYRGDFIPTSGYTSIFQMSIESNDTRETLSFDVEDVSSFVNNGEYTFESPDYYQFDIMANTTGNTEIVSGVTHVNLSGFSGINDFTIEKDGNEISQGLVKFNILTTDYTDYNEEIKYKAYNG
jgi:hypothetical protein